jgi:hypothetical protein
LRGVSFYVYEVLESVQPHGMGWPEPPPVSHGIFATPELARTKQRELARHDRVPYPILSVHVSTLKVEEMTDPEPLTRQQIGRLLAEAQVGANQPRRGYSIGTSDYGVEINDRSGKTVTLDWPDALAIASTIQTAAAMR